MCNCFIRVKNRNEFRGFGKRSRDLEVGKDRVKRKNEQKELEIF